MCTRTALRRVLAAVKHRVRHYTLLLKTLVAVSCTARQRKGVRKIKASRMAGKEKGAHGSEDC